MGLILLVLGLFIFYACWSLLVFVSLPIEDAEWRQNKYTVGSLINKHKKLYVEFLANDKNYSFPYYFNIFNKKVGDKVYVKYEDKNPANSYIFFRKSFILKSFVSVILFFDLIIFTVSSLTIP